MSVPKTEWELTTTKLLTMEWIDGCRANDVEKLKVMGIDPKQVRNRGDPLIFGGCEASGGGVLRADLRVSFDSLALLILDSLQARVRSL